MASMYFVWKDPNCNGIDPEWIQITRKQFNEFTRRPENKGRKFTRTPIDPENRFKGVYVVEATNEAYRKWDAGWRKAQRGTDVLDLPKRKFKEQKCGVRDDEMTFEDTSEEYEANVDGNGEVESAYSNTCVGSMEEYADSQEELTLHDMIADPTVDVERDALIRMQLEETFSAAERLLTKAEKKVFYTMFRLGRDPLSAEETASILGCSHQNVSKTVERIRKN